MLSPGPATPSIHNLTSSERVYVCVCVCVCVYVCVCVRWQERMMAAWIDSRSFIWKLVHWHTPHYSVLTAHTHTHTHTHTYYTERETSLISHTHTHTHTHTQKTYTHLIQSLSGRTP